MALGGSVSPTKDALHNELEMKAAVLRLSQENIDANMIPSGMKAQQSVAADVCFGCVGDCSDATCGSKKAAELAIQVGVMKSASKADFQSKTSKSALDADSGDTPGSSNSFTPTSSSPESRRSSFQTANKTTDTNENEDTTEEENGNHGSLRSSTHASYTRSTPFTSSIRSKRIMDDESIYPSKQHSPCQRPGRIALKHQQSSLCMPEYASTAACVPQVTSSTPVRKTIIQK